MAIYRLISLQVCVLYSMCCVTTSLERQHTSMFNLPGLTASFLWTSSTPYYCVDSFEQSDPAHGAIKQQAPASRPIGYYQPSNMALTCFQRPSTASRDYLLSAICRSQQWPLVTDYRRHINNKPSLPTWECNQSHSKFARKMIQDLLLKLLLSS